MECRQFVIVAPSSADAMQRSWRRPSQLSDISTIESTVQRPVTPYESYNGERDRGLGTVTLCASNWFSVAGRVHAEPLVTITVETYFLLLIFNTNYCYVITFLDLSICYDTQQYPDTYYLSVIDVRISTNLGITECLD